MARFYVSSTPARNSNASTPFFSGTLFDVQQGDQFSVEVPVFVDSWAVISSMTCSLMS